MEGKLFRVIGITGKCDPQPRFHFLPTIQNAWGSSAELAFIPLHAALDAGVTPLSSRSCDTSGADGFAFDAIDLEACRWLALWAELPDEKVRAAYANALAGYAQARHDSGVFERPDRK